jgi:hypothetical protein
MSKSITDDAHKAGFDCSFAAVEYKTNQQPDLQMRIASLRQGLRACNSLDGLLGFVNGAKKVLDLMTALPATQRLVMKDSLDSYVVGVCANLGTPIEQDGSEKNRSQ